MATETEKTSIEWDLATKQAALSFTYEVSIRTSGYLIFAVKYANEKHRETPQDFWRKLFLLEKGGKPHSILKKGENDHNPNQCPADPYLELDFQAVCKFLLYGKKRV